MTPLKHGHMHSTLRSRLNTFVKDYVFDLDKTAQRVGTNIAAGAFSSFTEDLRKSSEPMLAYARFSMEIYRLSVSFMDLIACVLNKDTISVANGRLVLGDAMFTTRVAMVVLNIYDTLKAYDVCAPASTPVAAAESGMFETFFSSFLLSSLLPPKIMAVLRNCSAFTNFKLVDDASWIFDLISFFVSLPRVIISAFMSDSSAWKVSIIDKLYSVELKFPFCALTTCAHSLRPLIDAYVKSPKCCFEPGFADDFGKRYTTYKLLKAEYLGNTRSLPTYLQHTDTLALEINRKLLHISSHNRVEPVWFLFVGPPGCGKTYTMNKVVQALSKRNTVYTHAPARQGSKDFFDTYNNEDVFVIDDVGQTSASYASFINMVSTTKCPLECAAAPLKDTKYFTSRVILSTTNNMNPTPSEAAGFTSLGAIHRRMRVVDFSRVTFNTATGRSEGTIVYKLPRIKPNDTVEFVYQDSKDITDNVVAWFESLIFDAVKAKIAEHKSIETGYSYPALPESGSITDQAREQIISFLCWLDSGGSFAVVTRLFSNPYTHFILGALQVTANTQTVRYYLEKLVPTFGEELVVIGVNIVVTAGAVYIADRLYRFVIDGLIRMFDPPDASPSAHIRKYYTSARKQPTKLSHVRAETEEKNISDLFTLPFPVGDCSALTRVKRATLAVRLQFASGPDTFNTTCVGTFAGRSVLVPYHSVPTDHPDSVYLTAYTSPTNICYDHVRVSISYVNKINDVALLELPRALPKYFPKLRFADSSNRTTFLSTPSGLTPTPDLNINDFKVGYKRLGFTADHAPNSTVAYSYHSSDMCGSLLLTADGGLVGMHIAVLYGDFGPDVTTSPDGGRGTATIFDLNTYKRISDAFSADVDFDLSARVAPVQKPGSFVRLEDAQYHDVPSKISIGPSLVHGVFPITRLPVQLEPNVKKQVKELASHAYEPVKDVSVPDIEFAENVISDILTDATVELTDCPELVRGNDSTIGPIDMKTSSGHGYPLAKSHYIDFERGTLKPEFAAQVRAIEDAMIAGTWEYNQYFADSPKEELRNVGKHTTPRLVKMSPLPITILVRKHLGWLLKYLHSDPIGTGVCVGINPFSKDWELLYQRHKKAGAQSFDGDYKAWDKCTSSPIQQATHSAILRKVKDPRSRAICEVLLQCCYTTPTVTVDRVGMTTHSTPSGIAITAEVNSLNNICYLAYAYSLLRLKQPGLNTRRPNPSDFFSDVTYSTYGDDNIVTVNSRSRSWFNAQTYAAVIARMGLEYTTSDKQPWSVPGRTLDECSFLKRGFYFHPTLDRIVAPLDAVTMCGTLNYISDPFRAEELTVVKLLNFQREAYLHGPEYHSLVNTAKAAAKAANLAVPWLSEHSLAKAFADGTFLENLVLN